MPLQVELYKKFVETGISELGSSSGKFSQSALSVITSLKKLCNRKYFYFVFDGKKKQLNLIRSCIDLRKMCGKSRWLCEIITDISSWFQFKSNRSGLVRKNDCFRLFTCCYQSDNQ